MAKVWLTLALASLGRSVNAIPVESSTPILVSGSPTDASTPIPESFISYSIEFSYLPDFAGNTSSPNTFSDNLLQNLGHLLGTRPYIRVGGSTQDRALYNASLKEAISLTYNRTLSPDQPITIVIGPSFFESYHTWPDTKFSHGFNMALSGISSFAWQSLLDTVPLACKALGRGKLLSWEYGNEPDLYAALTPYRPSTWNESTYVEQWLNGTRAIKSQLAKACPHMLSNESYGLMGPSFAQDRYLDPVRAFMDGLDDDKDIKLISMHNYIGSALQPGVTLQGTLMNHTNTVQSVRKLLDIRDNLTYTGIPYILGETNSLSQQGAPGLSNAFGAALWNFDFNLYTASQGIKRVHMHQGTDYRYSAWQPVQTSRTSIGTKAPYYGNVAAAAMLGDLTRSAVQIAHILLPNQDESAYSAYENGELRRIAVINFRQYNHTVNGTTSIPNPVPRPSKSYTFQLPSSVFSIGLQRLAANGSDAITGITFDGWSYNWELQRGRPVRLQNVTIGEVLKINNGCVTVEVPDSSAVILNLHPHNRI